MSVFYRSFSVKHSVVGISSLPNFVDAPVILASELETKEKVCVEMSFHGFESRREWVSRDSPSEASDVVFTEARINKTKGQIRIYRNSFQTIFAIQFHFTQCLRAIEFDSLSAFRKLIYWDWLILARPGFRANHCRFSFQMRLHMSIRVLFPPSVGLLIRKA